MAGHVYALLVGIDAYTGVVPPLSGCVNDVTAFGEVLRGRVAADELGDGRRHRRGRDPRDRHDRVRRAPRAGRAEDVALFYYSGHGAHQDAPEELWDFEPDHQNETLVLVDSREPGGWDLADKELAALIAAGRRERLPPARGARLLPLRRRHPRRRGGRAAGPRRTRASARSRASCAGTHRAGRGAGRRCRGGAAHPRPRPGPPRPVDAARRPARAARGVPLLGEGQGDHRAGQQRGAMSAALEKALRAVGGQAVLPRHPPHGHLAGDDDGARPAPPVRGGRLERARPALPRRRHPRHPSAADAEPTPRGLDRRLRGRARGARADPPRRHDGHDRAGRLPALRRRVRASRWPPRSSRRCCPTGPWSR